MLQAVWLVRLKKTVEDDSVWKLFSVFGRVQPEGKAGLAESKIQVAHLDCMPSCTLFNGLPIVRDYAYDSQEPNRDDFFDFVSV